MEDANYEIRSATMEREKESSYRAVPLTLIFDESERDGTIRISRFEFRGSATDR